MQPKEQEKEQDDSGDSFEEILQEKEEEDYEIITGLREKIVRINSLSLDKSRVSFNILNLIINCKIKTWISCGTSKGFRVYLQKELKLFLKREGSTFFFESGVQSIQALYTSFIFALVPDGLNKKFSDTKIYLWDEKQQQVLKEIECFHFITKFELMRQFLVVHAEGKFPRISIFSITTGEADKMFILSQDTKPFTINNDEKRPILAFLKDSNTMQIYNFLSKFDYFLESKYDEVQSIALSQKGDKIACSNKDGTYISIYSLPERELQVELYRGMKSCKIKQMSFFSNNKYFLIHSDRETLHIYDIMQKTVNYTLIPIGIVSMIQNKYLSSFAKYYITPHKLSKKKEKEAFLGEKGIFQESLLFELEDSSLMIIKDNGDFERMGFDPEKGGWGIKLKEKEWFDGWDLIEENLKGIMKILGTAIARNLKILRK